VTTTVELIVLTFTDATGTDVTEVRGCADQTPVGEGSVDESSVDEVASTLDAAAVERHGLEKIVGPDLAAWHAIGSELAPLGSPTLGGVPEQSAAPLVVLQQQEAAQHDLGALGRADVRPLWVATGAMATTDGRRA
jgi:hypothetical protein